MATAEDHRPEQVIDDPEEYSQKKRVRDLLERRNEVIEARNRAIDEQTLGSASEQVALRHYQSRIESLIIDLYTKFGGLETDGDGDGDGTDYLTEEPIDTVTIYPPEEILPDTDDDMAPGVEPPGPKQETIYGLEWFIDNEPVVAAEFTTYSWNPPGERTAVGQRFVPTRTLDKALLACMEFMDSVGIDADLSETEQQTKIDRDLLKEVDEWRQQNVDE